MQTGLHSHSSYDILKRLTDKSFFAVISELLTRRCKTKLICIEVQLWQARTLTNDCYKKCAIVSNKH